MGPEDRLARAGLAFDQLLNHVGTAAFPDREDPAAIDRCAEVMDAELAAYAELRDARAGDGE